LPLIDFSFFRCVLCGLGRHFIGGLFKRAVEWNDLALRNLNWWDLWACCEINVYIYKGGELMLCSVLPDITSGRKRARAIAVRIGNMASLHSLPKVGGGGGMQI